MSRSLVFMLSLSLVACASAGTDTTVVEATPTSTVGAPVTSKTTVPLTTTSVALDPFESAVAATISASSYEFGGQLIVVQASSEVVTGLHGWVYDGDQLLVTEVGTQIVETLVVDGVAIVTKDGQSTATELGAVEPAPSFELLGMIDVREEDAGLVRGLIPAAVMNGEGAEGFVDVTVWFTDVVVAYSILDPGAWELSMTFSQVGTFDPANLP